MPADTRATFYVTSELSSPTLRGAFVGTSLKIPEHGLESFRRRISDMDNFPDGSGEGSWPHFSDYDEYESLPEQSKFTTHMMAGAMAGMMEHCVMYPVDCIKTRMQSMRPEPNARYRNVFNAFATIVRNEGIYRTFRGLNAVAIGAGPSHALYFACYEKMKTVLSKNPGQNPVANAVAGGIATILHDAAMNPIDVIKQRLQMYQSPFKNATECLRHILRTEGSQAFYRSYTTQLTMNIPFQSVHFVVYELGQETLNPSRQYNPISHVVAGGLAGATAAAITTPLDVCKTLLNTQENSVLMEKNSAVITGMGNAIRTIYHLDGVRGFFKGVTARVIFQMPATALSWSAYEFFKYFISKKRKE